MNQKIKRILACLSLTYLLVSWTVNLYGQYSDTTRVAIHDQGDYYEMENGYLGVRIPKATLFNINTPDYVPAPIRSIYYRDQTESNNFPNYLTSPTPALTMTVSILQQTTDTCKIKVSYTFDKPELNDGTTVWEPAGPGYYHVTFQMVVDEKACMVFEESDFEVGYSLKVSNGLDPDKARYVGFRSTSIPNGYDINNEVYVKNDVEGWNAELDLTFGQRKDYDAMYNWGPWGVNTGWNWQLFNNAAPSTANTFGIFHGRPSKLLGAQVSDANIWTEPASIADLHGWCDEDGNCHYIWISENNIWYKSLDDTGTWSTEEIVASGLVHPFVFAEGNTVNIVAINPLTTTNPIRLLKKIGAGSWTLDTVVVDATIDDPFVYGASDGTNDFILFNGTRSGQEGFFLYSAAFNTTTFTFADDLPEGVNFTFRSANRPDFRKRPNGDLVFTYKYGGNYQSFNVILNGTTTFALSNNQPFGTDGTFGMAIDPRTGDFFFVEQGTFEINYIDLNGIVVDNEYSTVLNAFAHNHQGLELPNRRSMATDDSGNALVHHNGYLQESYFYYFDSSTNSWTDLTNSTWQEIEYPHVHFNAGDGVFYIVGKYQGKLARFSYNGSGNPVFVESFNSTEQHSAGVKIEHIRLPANQNYHPDIKFEWGIFAGNKGPDLLPLDTVQTISTAQNRLSGLAKKVEAYQNTPATFSSTFLNGGIYISPADVQAIIDKVKNDNAFYTKMWQLDASYKVVMDAWRDPTTTTTNLVYNSIVEWADSLINDLKYGDGIYSFYHFYSQGANEMRRHTTHMSGLMADGRLSVAQVDTLKKKAALFARVLWDNDFVPMQDSSGIGLGTANMFTSYKSYRWFFAMLLKDDPEFAARANAVPQSLKEELAQTINGVGAPINNSHYLQTANDGLIFTALQLKNLGIVDEFAQNDTLRMFSDFLFFLQTPESVRFSGNRKFINFGDGTEESAAIFGLLGTGYSGTNEELSKQLMYAYRHGPERGSDFGPVVVAINHELPDTNTIHICSGHFPGYMSTFRAGLGTNQESASWMLNGDWLSDHRNDDRGAVMMYALGAPMVLQYGNFYNPYIQGGHMQNIIVPEILFPEWNNPVSQPFLLPQVFSWFASEQEDFFMFGNSASSSAMMDSVGTHWHRKFYQFNPNEDTPIFVIKDSLNQANTDYIWNMSFTSDGTVATPAGNIDPPERLWDYQSATQQNPAASGVIPLPAGSLNRFDFSGINWPIHPSGGIDFEVYADANVAQEATISEWAHTFIPVHEAQEFLATNGTSFEERQQMLRIKGKEHFYTVIVPYFKGMRPSNLNVSKTGNLLTVTSDDFTFNTNLYYSTYTDSGKDILTTFNDQSLTLADCTISGGPMELEVTSDTIIARLHGEIGSREVSLPSALWGITNPSPNATFDSTTGKWTLTLPVLDSLHNSYRGGFSQFIFRICSPPSVNAPTLTQPTCTSPNGTIVVNATGSDTLSYSVNSGVDWQTSPTFSGLVPGNYNIMVRLQGDSTCIKEYAGNPVVITPPPTAETYYLDNDGDGFGDPNISQTSCSQPSGYVADNTDCDDADGDEFPGQNWFLDADGDGYSPGTSTVQCERPANHFTAAELTQTSGDCNDNNPNVNPGATETCNGIDDDCDTEVDEGVLNTFYQDSDGDGFGNPAVTQAACSAPPGYVADNTDCDDADGDEFPGQNWFLDADGDGYSPGTFTVQCERPANHFTAAELTQTSGDCNDNNPNVNPGATETCNGIDDDCDTEVDEGVLNTFYQDSDGDGFGDPAVTQAACSAPAGYVADNTDNCPTTFNPDQDDEDEDGVGDICQECPVNLTIYPYAPEQTTFKAQEGVLTSSGVTVPNGTSRIYKAGDSVQLNAEFEVELGGELDVLIETCTPNPVQKAEKNN